MNCVLPIRTCDIANGPGVRVTLFVTGCRNNCPGCFNKEAQSFSYGVPFTKEIHQSIIDALKPDYVAGLTVLGGEPFEPENQEGLVDLIEDVKKIYPNKSIWMYTGYVLENDLFPGKRKYTQFTDRILKCLECLVDGPFIEAEKDISLPFRGSRNQRILHLNNKL